MKDIYVALLSGELFALKFSGRGHITDLAVNRVHENIFEEGRRCLDVFKPQLESTQSS